MDDKELLIQIGDKLLYTDGTYNCYHWRAGDYSLWKIEGGKFLFKHSYMTNFECQKGGFLLDMTSEGVIKIQEALDKLNIKLIEEIMLGNNTESE